VQRIVLEEGHEPGVVKSCVGSVRRRAERRREEAGRPRHDVVELVVPIGLDAVNFAVEPRRSCTESLRDPRP